MNEKWLPDGNFAIVAYDRNRAIGMDDQMLWRPRQELRSDSEHMWAVLRGVAESPRGLTLLGGARTLLPLLGILPSYIDDVLVYTRGNSGSSLTKQLGRNIRAISSPDDLDDKTDRIVCDFGGSKTYRDFLPEMRYVLATEIDITFPPANRHFLPLHPDFWQEKARETMVQGQHDRYPAEFVVYERR